MDMRVRAYPSDSFKNILFEKQIVLNIIIYILSYLYGKRGKKNNSGSNLVSKTCV